MKFPRKFHFKDTIQFLGVVFYYTQPHCFIYINVVYSVSS